MFSDTKCRMRAGHAALNSANSLRELGVEMEEISQTEMYTSERLKKIEQVLIETLQTLPQDAQELFLAAYEANLGAAKL